MFLGHQCFNFSAANRRDDHDEDGATEEEWPAVKCHCCSSHTGHLTLRPSIALTPLPSWSTRSSRLLRVLNLRWGLLLLNSSSVRKQSGSSWKWTWCLTSCLIHRSRLMIPPDSPDLLSWSWPRSSRWRPKWTFCETWSPPCGREELIVDKGNVTVVSVLIQWVIKLKRW